MSRFTRQEEQSGRYNGIAGFMNRLEKGPITNTEDTMIYGVVSYLRYIVDIPIEDIRNVLDAPHETIPDVTIGTLVSTAINDLACDNGAIHVAMVNNSEDPFICAGVVHDDKNPGSTPIRVFLILNSASPEAYGWNHMDQVPTTKSLLETINVFATAGYILLDELSKNSAMVARRKE